MKALLYKEWLLTIRRWQQMWQPVVFLLLLMTVFSLALGEDQGLIQQVAPGMLWVGLMLSVLLSAEHFFRDDAADGSLEQLRLSGHSILTIVWVKFSVHWCVAIVPICLILPVMAVVFNLPSGLIAVIALTIIIGSPALIWLAMLGAAIVLSISRGGLLLLLLILPLQIPVLLFALSVVFSYTNGEGAIGAFSGALMVQVAMTIMAVSVLPWCVSSLLFYTVEDF